MSRRAGVAHVVTLALVLVALVGGSSPAAHPDRPPEALDLLASAHATSAEPSVAEAAFDVTRVRGADVEADTAAVASSTCDQCVTESTALHVVFAARPRQARLDNVANAWAQGCTACGSTALSVQVVVLRGRPDAYPNNRAVALNAACDTCRTSALAFQVVLVADDAAPLGRAELADLRTWFDAQAAALRASVAQPDPAGTTTTPEPTPDPNETATPTPRAGSTSARRARRDAATALDDLTALLVAAVGVEPVSADVEVSR